MSNKIPIIIDTDFGYAMDDVFAISFALQKSIDTFDIKLISTASLNTTNRAILLSKFLSIIGYNNIDIAIGIHTPCENNPSYIYNIKCVGPIWPWIHTINQSLIPQYKGKIYSNGISKMVEIIKQYSATNPIYIICLAPMDNIASIFEQYPLLRKNVRLFAMSGSLFSSSTPYGKFAEWNILSNVSAAQYVYNKRNKYSFNKPIIIVTWDTGYFLQIKGNQYQNLLNSKNILGKTIIDIYRIQFMNGGYTLDEDVNMNPNYSTPSLFDLEITWLAYYIGNKILSQTISEIKYNELLEQDISYLELKPFRISINNNGYMVNNNSLSMIYAVVKWKKYGEIFVASQVTNAILINDYNVIFDAQYNIKFRFSAMDFIGIVIFCIGCLLMIGFGWRKFKRKGYSPI